MVDACKSIKIDDFEKMKLQIIDYSKNPALEEAITKYYTLLRMTFESTNVYKIFETSKSQILRFTLSGNPMLPNPPIIPNKENQIAIIEFICPNCKNHTRIQANIGKSSPIQNGNVPFPLRDNIFICPKCKTANNILPLKLQIEAQSGKKIVE